MIAAIVVLYVLSCVIIAAVCVLTYLSVRILGTLSLEIKEVAKKHNLLVYRLTNPEPDPSVWGGATQETRQ